MALNLTILNGLQPRDKPYKVSDGGGLNIVVQPNGSKLWRLSYRYAGKQQTLALGKYPMVKLVEARAMAADAKKMLSEGKDPGSARKALRAGSGVKSFDDWAGEYIEFRKSNRARPVAQSTVDKFEWSRAAVRRQFGGDPITDITVPTIVAAIRAIERTGRLHKSTKAKSFISQVFRYAAASGVQVMDPGPVMNGALLKPEVRHHAALTDPVRVGEMLRAIDAYTGDASTLYAMQMAPHLFLRAGEIRAMRWDWVNEDEALITVPAAAMKGGQREHTIPMSRQVREMMATVRQFSGRQQLVFPSPVNKGRPLSENTLNVSLRRMGFTKQDATFHGLRTTASTILNEMALTLGTFTDRTIEMQLSHKSGDQVANAYNRATLMNERRVMMQTWSDLLDEYRRLPPPG